MKQHERDQLGLQLTEIAFVYGHDLPREKAKQFIDLLQKYIPASFAQYQRALQCYFDDPKNKTFPSLAGLRVYIDPKASVESQANELSSRVVEAISRFGWNNGAEARAYLGDTGWELVKRSGGWAYVCENLGLSLNPGTFRAQARDLAKSLIEAQKTENNLGLGYNKTNILEFRKDD